METQWPLVIFTLFVCLTCGLLGAMSIAALKGQGRELQFTSLVTAAASLVIGGLGAFLHLQHWERIFNGFGHITSGITQELIGCVVLAAIMAAWFILLRGGKSVPKALAWITIAAAALMVCATAHSYYMPARPAWGLGLIVFYLANACLLGPVALWVIAAMKKGKAAEETSIQLTFFGAILQLAANVIYAIMCATATIANYGHYADPTQMTTAPVQVDSLLSVMMTGNGALTFWCSIVCAVVALACAIVAKKKVGESKTYLIITVIVTVAASVLFRVLIYQLGYSLFLLY